MRELNARLRVEGLSDEEAAELPVQVDALTLSRTEISTWRTDAGDIDLLVDISGKGGRLYRYEDLAGSARRLQVGGVYVRVARLQDVIASKEQANRAKDREALPELYELRAQHGLDKPGTGNRTPTTGRPRRWHPPRLSRATKGTRPCGRARINFVSGIAGACGPTEIRPLRAWRCHFLPSRWLWVPHHGWG